MSDKDESKENVHDVADRKTGEAIDASVEASQREEEVIADAIESVEEIAEVEAEKVDDVLDSAEEAIEQAAESEATQAAEEIGRPEWAEHFKQEILAEIHGSNEHETEPVVMVGEGSGIVDDDEFHDDTPPEETHWYWKKRKLFGRS